MTTRLGALAAIAALPLVAVLLYLQADERGEELQRAVAEHRRIAHLAADRASEVVIDAERLVASLAQFQGAAGVTRQSCSAVLAGVLTDRPTLINVVVTNERGELVCSGRPVDAVSFLMTTRPWLATALRAEGPVLGDPFETATTGQPALVVASRIVGAGRLAGARTVAASIDISSFSRSFGRGELPDGAVVALLDRTNRVIASLPSDSVRPGIVLPLPAAADGVTDPTDVYAAQHVGGPILVAQVRDAGGLRTGYHVILSVDGHAATAAAEARWRTYMLLIALGVLGAAALTTFAARRWVVSPTRALAAVARRLAGGDFSARAELRAGFKGIADLGDAVNDMADAIETQRDERDRATADLVRSKETYELLFDQNPSPMWVFDRQTLRFLAVNDTAIARYGYTRDEFLRMRLTEIRPAEEVNDCLAAIEDADGNVHRRWRHQLKSGELIHVEINWAPIVFEGRLAVLVCVRDMTAAVRAEAALVDAEERFRYALEAVQVGVWDANLQTGDCHWSTTAESMHGLQPGGFGKTFDDFLLAIHPDDRSAARSEVMLAILEARNANIEYRPAAIPDRLLRSIGHYVYDKSGRAVRGVGVILDITDRRRMEDQLRHSQKLEAVGQLAGGVAHDFNNLLTIIAGNAELAMAAQQPPSGSPEMNEILKATARAAQLTRQLLSFSRKQVLHPERIDVADMVRKLMPMLKRLIEEDITLEYGVCMTSPTILADRTEIENAIINLVVNARDAQPHGGLIRLEVAQVDDTPLGTVRITVVDRGTGMSPDVLSRACEPFFTTKEPGKGTGLGLASVYGTVRQVGGEVQIESAVGKGTRVTLALPLATCALAPREDAPAPAAGPRRGTVLLVEDQDGVREFAARVLRGSGYKVLEAVNAEEAEKIATDFPGSIAAVVSDVVMPGPSIADAIINIRKRRPSIAIVMTSGYPAAQVRRRLGALDVEIFPKPFSMRDLLGRVSTAIEEHAVACRRAV